MNRLHLLAVLCLFAIVLTPVPAADDKFATVQVTGSVQLPAGASLPAKCRVEVMIGKIKPGSVITFIDVVGRTQMNTVTSAPIAFKVGCPKSVMKDAKADSFILKAAIYDTTKGSKLVFETTKDDRVQPFTTSLDPKQNVTVPVRAVAAK